MQQKNWENKCKCESKNWKNKCKCEQKNWENKCKCEQKNWENKCECKCEQNIYDLNTLWLICMTIICMTVSMIMMLVHDFTWYILLSFLLWICFLCLVFEWSIKIQLNCVFRIWIKIKIQIEMLWRKWKYNKQIKDWMNQSRIDQVK